jgi:hypothetical protein
MSTLSSGAFAFDTLYFSEELPAKDGISLEYTGQMSREKAYQVQSMPLFVVLFTDTLHIVYDLSS